MNGLSYLIQSSLILAVLTFFYHLLLRRTTWFGMNRRLLWLNMILAVALPLVKLPEIQLPTGWVAPGWIAPVHQFVQQTTPAEPIPEPIAATQVGSPEKTRPSVSVKRTAEAMPGWRQYLARAYVAGVILLLLRFLLQLASLGRLIAGSWRRREDGLWLIENTNVSAPFSFFNWIVLDSGRYSAEELNQILVHEQIHCRQWHSLDRVAAEIVQIVFWFNPFAWWHGRLVQQNLEFITDRDVLDEGIDRRQYQYHLLKTSLMAGGQKTELVNSFGPGNLKARLRTMNEKPSPQMQLRMGGFLLILLTVILWLREWPVVQQGMYMATSPNEVYWVLSSRMSSVEIRQLQQRLGRENIKFYVQNIQYTEDGKFIRQAKVTLWSPQSRQLLSFDAGVPYGRQPILPVGFRCSEGECTVGLVDKRFPGTLRELALQDETHTLAPGGTPDMTNEVVSNANLQFGLYEVFYLNDFIESNYYGLRSTIVRITEDHHLDLYQQYKNAVIIYDGREIDRNQLRHIPVLDLKKVAVYKGQAAVTRLGDERARRGLVVLTRRLNDYIRDNYAIIQGSQPYYPRSLSDE